MNPENQTKEEDTVKQEPTEVDRQNKENGSGTENKQNGSETADKENEDKMETDIKEEPKKIEESDKEVLFTV